jgi:hypothetical protein
LPCPVRLRHANAFALSAVDVVEAVPAAMEALALQTLLAEHTGPSEQRNGKTTMFGFLRCSFRLR